MSTYKFPFVFDPARLKDDLNEVSGGEWIEHFNKLDYETGWSGVMLRSVGGSLTDMEGTRGHFAETTVLARCPYVREVVNAFQCDKKRVRFLRLEAGAVIKRHIDEALSFELGEVRIHVPIVTHPAVEFYLNDKRVVLKEGEAWYMDVTFPHSVKNGSTIDRVHLVLDCVVNDWIRSIMPLDFDAPPWKRRLAYQGRRVRFKIWNASRLLVSDRKEMRRRAVNMFRRNFGGRA